MDQKAPGRPGAARWLSWVAVAGLYVLVSLVCFRAFWPSGGDRLPQNQGGDPLFNLTILKWGAHQIRHGLPDVWSPPFFHPTKGALAFSDHLLGPAAQLALFLEAVPNPVAGYNFLFLTSFAASAFATCWVVRRGGFSWPAALAAGALFAWAPFRLAQMAHLQILLMQWIPLTLWSWDRLLAERTPRRAAGFLVFYLLHVTGGCYLAYMIHVPLAALAASRLASEGRSLVAARSLRVLLPVALVAGGTLAALFLPYVRPSHRVDLVHPDEAIEENAALLASYLQPSQENAWFAPAVQRSLRSSLGGLAPLFFRKETALFAGFLPTLLFAAGFLPWWRRFRPPAPPPLPAGRRLLLGALPVLALATWVFGDLLLIAHEQPGRWPRLAALGWEGPALLLAASLGLWLVLRRRWGRGPLRLFREMDAWERGIALSGLLCFALSFPLVYLPLSRIVPGLDGMRVPVRFYAFLSFSIAWFAARGVDGLLGRFRERSARSLATAALLVLLAVELAPRPVRSTYVPREVDFPPVYSWIARQRDVKALIELPVNATSREARYMYFGTLHWRPIANGYSGFVPSSHREIARRIRFLPDEEGLDLLRDLWITHLVVHAQGDLRAQELRRWESEFAEGDGRRVELVFRSGDDRVYRLLAEPASSSTPNRAGLWKSAGLVSVGDQPLNSAAPSRGRSIR